MKLCKFTIVLGCDSRNSAVIYEMECWFGVTFLKVMILMIHIDDILMLALADFFSQNPSLVCLHHS